MVEKFNLIMYPIVMITTFLIFLKISSLLKNSVTQFAIILSEMGKFEKIENVNPLLKLCVVLGLILIAIIFFVLIGALIIEINLMEYEIVDEFMEIVIVLLVAYVSTLLALVHIFSTVIKKD